MVPECHTKTCTYTVCHMVPEMRAQDLQLHGLPHGAREPHVKTYTVCHMVPECHTKTCSYQVCHMVPEMRVQDLHLPGLPHGAGVPHVRSAL